MRRIFAWIGAIASLITIFVFITGLGSVQEVGKSVLVNSGPTVSVQFVSPVTATLTAVLSTSTVISPILPSDVSPESLLPGTDDVSGGMVMQVDKLVSNEDFAKGTTDPAATLDLLQEYGRVSGYRQVYFRDRNGEISDMVDMVICFLPKPSVVIEVEIYETWEGAKKVFSEKGFEYLTPWNAVGDDEYTDVVGDEAYIRWGDRECRFSPVGNALAACVEFQRYNVLGSACTASWGAAMSDKEMQSLAIQFAQFIDSRILAKAK